MRSHVQQFAAGFGVAMEFPTRMQNTRRALAVGELARAAGKQDSFRDLAMKAYWRDGLDLENEADLRGIAARAGLPADAVDRVDSEPQWLARVDAVREEALALGVTGIPTFIFGHLESALEAPRRGGQAGPRPVAVVGCQPYAALLQALAQASE